MKIEWRSFADMAALCRQNMDRVREIQPDIIVGIPRSGMLPASMLALGLGLPLVDLNGLLGSRIWPVGAAQEVLSHTQRRRVLLVDDASAWRREMPQAVKRVQDAYPKCEVLACVVFATPESADNFFIAMEAVPKPRMFEWNWWRSGNLKHCGVDIDGVICADPTKEQKSTPARYAEFIDTARPLWLPKKRIRALITGRDNAHREGTQRWMAHHGVTFDALHMHEGPSPRDTVKHALNKARFYSADPHAYLFIESDERQAQHIAQHTGRPVLCLTSQRYYPC